jgi:beta-mannosidase
MNPIFDRTTPGPSFQKPEITKWCLRLFARFAAAAAVLLSPAAGAAIDASKGEETLITPRVVTLLSGDDWELGSFPLGEGERQGVFRPDFDASGFRAVAVPGEVQRQIGLEGMDLYYQREKLTLVNEKEWWYRKEFTVPKDSAGKTLRLVFDGVDYFCTVWLNGEKLGEHEGAYVSFEHDVTSKVRLDGPNQLTVKVTCPWLPEGRGFLEYMKGELAEAVPGQVTEFPFPPYVLGPTWDGLPAGGNAAFPMGLFRDVKLVVSGSAVVSDLAVATKSLNLDGSATLKVSGTIRNYGQTGFSATLSLRIAPDNFEGDAVTLPAHALEVVPGESSFELEATVAHARLWWTWDTGAQDLYKATATIAARGAADSDSREVVFGIRTIERREDMSYWLNGRRIFFKGAWYPISDVFGSKPTRETFETDLELFRAANMNHLVNFTVVEKPEFYDLCDRLGILNFFEFPFIQFGPMAVMSHSNPRREAYVNQALSQVRQTIITLRSHPSIVVWAPFAEAQIKGSGWGAAGHDFDQYGYQEFADRIEEMVAELAPGTIYHESFCDAGEQHYWAGTAGPWRATPYQEQFQANTGFVSEYGAIAMPALESLEKMLTPEELWSEKIEESARWYGLPIDVATYSYQTSFDYVGLAGVLDRIRRFVDTDIKSAAELVDGSQLYQAFLFQYSTEVFRRKKYNSINGTRIWAYLEPTPGIRFGFLDYYRVPKMGYYFLKRAQAPFAVNFAYEDALESQVGGGRISIPVWIVNDHSRRVSYDLHCEIVDLKGQIVWSRDFPGEISVDSAIESGLVEWVAPETPGVYVLKAHVREKGGPLEAVGTTYLKVAPRLFPKPVRMLLIGQREYCRPISLIAAGLGIDTRVIDEDSIRDLAILADPVALRKDFDLVWLSSFDSLWKLLDTRTADGLKQAIHDGLGFIHSGGPGSFHGGSIRASLLNFTSLAEVLPVRLLDRDDLFLGEPPIAAYDTLMTTSPVLNIQLASHAPSEWEIPGWNEGGLPGFNRVLLKEDGKQLVTIEGHPLVVTGQFGKGRTVAFTGFTPTWKERRSPWDRKMISSHQLDQELAADPQFRNCFAFAMRLLASALGTQPDTTFDGIFEAHRRPLFETLQDQPEAQLDLPAKMQFAILAGRGEGVLQLRNGSTYARLVRVRAEWEGADSHAPYLVIYDDNYFDLIPGETKDLAIEIRMPAHARGRVAGRLIVEGSNVPSFEVPVSIEIR